MPSAAGLFSFPDGRVRGTGRGRLCSLEVVSRKRHDERD